MDTIWKKIRQKSNLPKNMVANKLGISEEKYDEIERGERELPRQYIDKLMKIKYENKENKIEFEIETAKANEFIQNTDWEKLENEFNYPTAQDLCKAMNIGVSTYYNVKHTPDVVAPKTKIKVYKFFMDPLNKYVNKNKDKGLVKFNDDGSLDVDWLLKTFGVTQVKLCEMLNINKTCISQWKTKKQMPCDETMKKLNLLLQEKLSGCPLETNKTDTLDEENIVENIEQTDIPETHEEEIGELGCACDVHNEDIYTTNTDICEEIIMEDKDYKIKELSEEIENLKRTIRCYEKLIERL